MNRLDLHKARAARLQALLRAQHSAVTHAQALEAVAAAHGATWAELRVHPDRPVLPLALARSAALQRLAGFRHIVPSDHVPDDVLRCEPGIDLEDALRRVLPERWHGLSLPLAGYDRVIVDLHYPIHLWRRGRPAHPLGSARVTAEDLHHIVQALGGLHEERAGLSDSFLMARGPDRERLLLDKLTLYLNHDHPKLGRTLQQRLGAPGHALIIGPSFEYLGPRLRDVDDGGVKMAHPAFW